ncbi:NCS1 nucleoside transporter family [Lactarius akahatsu]|uniref:NCS1 nucleoside transporter family n=1 Tax=Lactarius akahatsu TaxID=416441 RepID=A0AAD4Q8F6_9AGAM|nr:NCS1 nucleoside transporter family [Lactarius akahatsu]
MFSSSYLLALIRPSTWKLQPEQSTFASNNAWSNKDMDPVPPHLQTWTTLSYITFWISCAANVTVWELASSMIAIGLSWRGALLAVSLGHLIIAIIIVLNGTIGVRLRVPFPVINRSSFGFWLSYFSVISLIILSMFWFGVQTFIGSECVYQMLKAIWPSIAHLPNHLPPSAKITSVELICYFIYWCFQLPFMFVSPHKIRWLFLAKTIIVPPTLLALLIWAAVKVPLNSSLLSQRSALSGSELSWAWLGALNSSLGFFSTTGVNMPNFTRYAKNERAQYAQLIVIPAAFTLASFVGIAVTSAGMTLYGQVLWDPLKLIDQWDNRACAFFASLAFLLSTLSANISANSLSAGNDMTALYPRYINIRRGQVICAFLGGWAFCPWKVLASAPGFLSFLSGYTVFIGPITGIVVTDYWLVHRTRVDVPAMYRPHGRYRYTYGVNWRAAAAMLVSVLPAFPGLIHSINASVHVGVGTRLFDIAYLLGFTLASTVYFVLSKLFPANETILECAIVDLEVPPSDGRASGGVEKGDVRVDETSVA